MDSLVSNEICSVAAADQQPGIVPPLWGFVYHYKFKTPGVR